MKKNPHCWNSSKIESKNHQVKISSNTAFFSQILIFFKLFKEIKWEKEKNTVGTVQNLIEKS